MRRRWTADPAGEPVSWAGSRRARAPSRWMCAPGPTVLGTRQQQIPRRRRPPGRGPRAPDRRRCHDNLPARDSPHPLRTPFRDLAPAWHPVDRARPRQPDDLAAGLRLGGGPRSPAQARCSALVQLFLRSPVARGRQGHSSSRASSRRLAMRPLDSSAGPRRIIDSNGTACAASVRRRLRPGFRRHLAAPSLSSRELHRQIQPVSRRRLRTAEAMRPHPMPTCSIASTVLLLGQPRPVKPQAAQPRSHYGVQAGSWRGRALLLAVCNKRATSLSGGHRPDAAQSWPAPGRRGRGRADAGPRRDLWGPNEGPVIGSRAEQPRGDLSKRSPRPGPSTLRRAAR